MWTAAAGAGVAPAVTAHAASGVAFVDVAGPQPPDPQAVAAMVRSLRAYAVTAGGSALVQEAPPEVKAVADVWGPVGDALGLMRRVKQRFDPTRTMSPGRFVGRI
jgi:glycolate oxidase FAD binding subunit